MEFEPAGYIQKRLCLSCRMAQFGYVEPHLKLLHYEMKRVILLRTAHNPEEENM